MQWINISSGRIADHREVQALLEDVPQHALDVRALEIKDIFVYTVVKIAESETSTMTRTNSSAQPQGKCRLPSRMSPNMCWMFVYARHAGRVRPRIG